MEQRIPAIPFSSSSFINPTHSSSSLAAFLYDPIKFFVPFLFFPAMPPQVDHPVPGQRGAMVPPKSNSDGNIVLKRSPSKDLKKIFLRAMRTSKMKSLFKFKRSRPRSPVDVVKNATSLLSYLNSPPHSSGTRHAEKVSSSFFYVFNEPLTNNL